MVNTTNTDYTFLTAEVVEGGMLNEQGVMNVALSFFDLNRNINTDAGEKEVILFKQVLPLAKVFCASMTDWKFLTESVEYEEDDVTNMEEVDKDSYTKSSRHYVEESDGVLKVYTKYKNFCFGYKLPNNFLSMRYINGDARIGYEVKGNEIYCNLLGCTIDYISSNLKNLPSDFGYLVAYKCAMEMAQHLDPQGDALNRSSALFSQTYSIMKQRDDKNFRLQNPSQEHFIDKSTNYWGIGGIQIQGRRK